MAVIINVIGMAILLTIGVANTQDLEERKAPKAAVAAVAAAAAKLPKIPPVLIPIPFDTCCTLGTKYVSLFGNGSQSGFLPGVSVGFSANSAFATKTCSRVGLVKINFQKGGGLGCGRRMLKIDITLGSVRGGHMINLGDSSGNNGFSGDGGTQENDAELHGVYPGITLWGSDKCKAKNLASLSNFLANTNRVIIYVSNEFTRFTDGNDVNYRICNECLFALNGQSDSEGPTNELVFLSLNKVISGLSRYGFGVCRATMRWICNMCDYETQ